MTFLRFFGVFSLLLLVSCEGSVAAGQEAQPIYNVSENDAEVNAAKERAIASLPQFYARLGNPAADETEFMVKFDILPGDEAEFVWATQLDRSTSPMTGTLANQPEFTEHRIGDRVPIPETEIIDWSYFRGDVMQGAYTHRVLVDRMDPEEAARMRAEVGW